MEAHLFIGYVNDVHKVNYSGEILYNVLLENYDKMMVNNMICETLHPENSVTKIYKYLKGLNYNESENLINIHNQLYMISKNNTPKVSMQII